MSATPQNPDAVSDSDILRIIAFILLVTLFNLWSVRHLGWGTTNPGIVALMLAGSGVAIKLLELMGELNRKRKLAIGDRIRPIFMVVLSTRWMSIGYTALLILSLMYSSILIVPGAADGEKEFTVTSPGNAGENVKRNLGTSGEVVLAGVFISPFGSTFSVKVDGYLEKLVTVYPFVGRTLYADTHLVKIPTVYIRPSRKALRSLKNRSKLVIRVSHPSKPDVPPTKVELKGHKSAYLIGEERQTPGYLPALWREELIARGAGSVLVAQTMQDWRNYTKVTADLMIEPAILDIRKGTVIQVDVVTPGGRCIAGGQAQIRKRRFVDLRLESYPQSKKCEFE